MLSAVDTIATGLTGGVVAAFGTLETDPSVTITFANAAIGDQVAAPVAGSIYIKTWKHTTAGAAGNPDLTASTAWAGELVNWYAIGTIV